MPNVTQQDFDHSFRVLASELAGADSDLGVYLSTVSLLRKLVDTNMDGLRLTTAASAYLLMKNLFDNWPYISQGKTAEHYRTIDAYMEENYGDALAQARKYLGIKIVSPQSQPSALPAAAPTAP